MLFPSAFIKKMQAHHLCNVEKKSSMSYNIKTLCWHPLLAFSFSVIYHSYMSQRRVSPNSVATQYCAMFHCHLPPSPSPWVRVYAELAAAILYEPSSHVFIHIHVLPHTLWSMHPYIIVNDKVHGVRQFNFTFFAYITPVRPAYT